MLRVTVAVHFSAGVLLLAILGLVFPACREEPPPPPPSETPAETTPAATPGPVSLRPPPTPSPKPQPIGATPGDTTGAGPQGSTDTGLPGGTRTPRAALPPGADGRDAPGSPNFLPRSGDLDGWVKVEPVVAADATQVARIVSADAAARLKNFALDSAAACTYGFYHGGGEPLMIRLVAYSARSPDDGYGIATILSNAPQSESCGGLCRVESQPRTRYVVWQGRVAIDATADRGGDVGRDDLRRFLLHIVSRIPRENPPAITLAMPTATSLPGRQWLVRHLAALDPRQIGLNPPLDFGQMSNLLGLGSQTLMYVGSHELRGARRPNTVWIVQYPSAIAARDAHRRIERFLADNPSAAWQSTNVLKPVGRFLVGTWTAEEESLQSIMPKIAAVLPS